MLRCAHHRLLTVPLTVLFFASACGDSGGSGLDPTDAGTGDSDAQAGDVGAPVANDGSTDASADASVAVDLGVPDGGAPDAALDAGPEDAGAFACAFPQTVTGVLGQEVSVSLDTSTTDLRPRDLGLLCGNTDPATRWAPQEIVAYEVPGTGPVAVRFSARNSGTPTTFDTVIQVRRGGCTSPPPLENGRFPSPTCFEDATENLQSPDFRSEGAIQATGGETLYFVVTGFSGGQVPQLEDRGPVTLTITTTENEAPTLTDATPFVFGQDVLIRLNGDDPDDNVRGAIINFRINGQIADIYGAGTTDGDISAIVYDGRPGEVRNHVRRPQIPLMLPVAPPPGVDGIFDIDAQQAGLDPTLGDFIRGAGIQQLGIRVFDDAYAISEERVVDVVLNGQRVGYGESCAAAICQEPYLCEADVCSAAPLAQTICDPANIVDSGLSGTSTVSQVTVTVPAGSGGFGTPSCVPPGTSAGREAVLSVEIPATGRFDLRATTDTDVTNGRDTILYLREDCIDPRTEVAGACNDDIGGGNDTSAFTIEDIAAGGYSLVVEPSATGATIRAFDVGIDLRLRPIVGEGEACDPAEVESRCDVGTCQGSAGAETCQL
jgi:hypothetical protein